MEITEIKIRRINLESQIKAIVSVTFDQAFVVHDIKVIELQDKLIAAMPSRKTPQGKYKDIVHPINVQMRDSLQAAIIEKYEQELSIMLAQTDSQ